VISPSPFTTDAFEAQVAGTTAHPLIRIRGTLDIGSIRPVLQLVRTLDLRGAQSLTMDLEGVTFIDAAGLRVLTTSRQRARVFGCPLVLSNPSRPVRRLLDLCGLENLFHVESGTSYGILYPNVA
jgi:anti-anti-sigma factor